MNALHFGAGNIGRGFIAPILKKDPQIKEIKFVEINPNVVEKINQVKEYQINEMGDEIKKILVTNVSASTPNNLFNPENKEFLKATSLITTAIGQTNLHFIVENVIKLIELKQKDEMPLIIICCENGNRVSSYFKKMLENKIDLKNVYFVDAVVDRIVPNQKNPGLELNVEQYYSWIVDFNQWPKAIPQITSVAYSQQIDSEINKKMCLLNGVHAAIAWHRYVIDQFQIKTIQEALHQEETQIFVKNLYHELVPIISQQYNFSQSYLTEYTNQLLVRFTNKHLVDDLERIARNPISKLQKNERILRPLLFATEHHLTYKTLLTAFKNGVNYDNFNEPEAKKMSELIKTAGKELAIKTLIKNLTDKECQMLLTDNK